MSSVEILDPGLRTTVQDAGRFGWEHLGVPRGGAADFHAYRWANRLAGNSDDLAAMESLLLGVSVRPDADAWVGITGANEVRIDSTPHPAWSGFRVRRGSTLRVDALEGARCYVAFHGGIGVEPVLGSRSTNLAAGFGGYHGRELRAGDVLPLGENDDAPMPAGGLMRAPPLRQPVRAPMRVVPGPHEDRLPRVALTSLLSRPFVVSPQSNEMGLRLLGEPLLPADASMDSAPMPAGGIQVTPAGQAIVLLNARGTIGGYPVLATVVTPDIWRLGQARPGDTLTFELVSVEAARTIALEAYTVLESARPVPADGWDAMTGE